jgi:hypothetical protein
VGMVTIHIKLTEEQKFHIMQYGNGSEFVRQLIDADIQADREYFDRKRNPKTTAKLKEILKGNNDE